MIGRHAAFVAEEEAAEEAAAEEDAEDEDPEAELEPAEMTPPATVGGAVLLEVNAAAAMYAASVSPVDLWYKLAFVLPARAHRLSQNWTTNVEGTYGGFITAAIPCWQ